MRETACQTAPPPRVTPHFTQTRAMLGQGVIGIPHPKPKTMATNWTRKQGQYLAYIYAYTKLHRRAPAERDMQDYFRVTPPTVHQMVLTLERRGFISREPGEARSIRILLRPEELPTYALW